MDNTSTSPVGRVLGTDEKYETGVVGVAQPCFHPIYGKHRPGRIPDQSVLKTVVYRACLFCHADLGRNDSVGSMDIGRRIAFDPIKGRLWAICTSCGRWNLTPFEERWEAVEECERLFRTTRLRVATDNIGLAQPRWGFELVRIGAALLPEIAAWRYGSKLLSRHSTVAGYAQNLGMSRTTVMRLRTLPRRHEVLARIQYAGTRITVRYAHLPDAQLMRPDRDETWRLRVRHDHGVSVLEGGQAMTAARVLLSALNDGKAPESMVRIAVAKLDDAGNSHNFFGRIGALALSTSWGRRPLLASTTEPQGPEPERSLAERLIVRLTTRSFWSRGGTGSEEKTPLHWIPDVDRLALEMAANEDAERKALAGELAQLEDAWREAEEIAAIADHLLTPDSLFTAPRCRTGTS